MSFKIAEDSNLKYTGVPHLVRNALEQPSYRRNLYQVFDNMDSDPLITALPKVGAPASRSDLLDSVSPVCPNAAKIREAAIDFCRVHQREGPPALAKGTLGHVRSFKSLVNAIGDPMGVLNLRAAEALLRDVIHDATPSDRLAKQMRALRGRALSRYQMWSYPAANPMFPFLEIGNRREEAINVLGLGYYAYEAPTEELVRWACQLPAGTAAYPPTAWDAANYPYWRPGGWTFRLDRDAPGVNEYVHEPPTGENLIAAIEPIS